MKLVKHTFKEQGKLEIIDDELITKQNEFELYFSLPMSALGLFEEEYGKPLVDVIIKNTAGSKIKGEELDSIEFSRAIACSMYIKVENGVVSNDEASKEEFKNMDIYKSIASDLPLRVKLVNCAIECLNDDATSSTKGDTKKSKK